MMIDLHCDTVSEMIRHDQHLDRNNLHFDLARAKTAGSILQVMALFSRERNVDAYLRAVLEEIVFLHREVARFPEQLYLAQTYQDLADNPDKIGLLLHLEGGECLGHSLTLLDALVILGLRSLGLTWNYRNVFADGVDENEGLTRLGRELVADCDRRGLILDLAHCAPRGALEALELTTRPVMISHANTWHHCAHRRNIRDDLLRQLRENGGIIGVTYVADFVCPEGAAQGATVAQLVQHILHLSEVVGLDHIALGSDFDGADAMVIPEVAAMPLLRAELEKNAFSSGEIDQIFAQNARRFLQAVL
jgi:membrane dipeptidase